MPYNQVCYLDFAMSWRIASSDGIMNAPRPLLPPRQAHIARLRFHIQSLSELVDALLERVAQGEACYVSTCAAYSFTVAHEDERVWKALHEADFLLADGMPLVWSQRFLGFGQAQRLYGPEIMWAMCQATANQPIRHYFYGGKGDTAQRLAERLLLAFPGLCICGYSEPPLLPERDICPDDVTVQMLNQAMPHIIWVGLGAPKQDIWMNSYRPHLRAPLLIGVGAAFDFLSGKKPQAAPLIQRWGFEWLFRLIHEPKRLWRRYLVYNLRFMRIILGWILEKQP